MESEFDLSVYQRVPSLCFEEPRSDTCVGVAYTPLLNVLALSEQNSTVRLYKLVVGSDLRWGFLGMLDGEYKFGDNGWSHTPSGHMVFGGVASHPALFVTDDVLDCVHIANVSTKAHVGYVGNGIGGVPGAKCVAARNDLLAVSCWHVYDLRLQHIVRLFRNNNKSEWNLCRVIEASLCMPYGLSFSGDGTELAVADKVNNRVCLFPVFPEISVFPPFPAPAVKVLRVGFWIGGAVATIEHKQGTMGWLRGVRTTLRVVSWESPNSQNLGRVVHQPKHHEVDAPPCASYINQELET